MTVLRTACVTERLTESQGFVKADVRTTTRTTRLGEQRLQGSRIWFHNLSRQCSERLIPHLCMTHQSRLSRSLGQAYIGPYAGTPRAQDMFQRSRTAFPPSPCVTPCWLERLAQN